MKHPAFSLLAAVAIFCVFCISCTNGPCRQLRHPELAMPTPAPDAASSTGDEKSDATVAKVPEAATESTVAADGRVLVGRPDGSTQCGIAKGKPPELMEKDLDGIKVYAHSKRPDGRMHIQVCGGPTGQLNVYEIPSGSLKEAERRGFKKFVPGG